MMDDTKRDVISAYNAAVERMRAGEAIMQTAPINGLRYQRAETAHSFALGEQSGIAHALELLGYALVIDDEDMARDITVGEE